VSFEQIVLHVIESVPDTLKLDDGIGRITIRPDATLV
jgi:hypothetical protein